MTAHTSGAIPSAGALVQLQGVSKAYRNPNETTIVFHDLDLELHRGEITCLQGPSGSGKSTIIALIAGLMIPDGGQVIFDGRDVGGLSDSERSLLRATRIGTVLQSGNLLPFLTAAENVAMAMRLAGAERSAAHVAEIWVRSVWRTVRTTSLGASRAVRRNGPPWPCRWRTRPTCCWPTKPSDSSIERPRRR